MKAKVIETGEIVEVYREPQHGKVSNIFREAVWFNGRMWNEDELDFSVNSKLKKVDLEKELSAWYYRRYKHIDRYVPFERHTGHFFENSTMVEIAKHFFELGLKTQQVPDEVKIGETKIYLEDDGGEPPYDSKQWLDLSCMEYEIPEDKFKDGDNVEIIIRKTQKGE